MSVFVVNVGGGSGGSSDTAWASYTPTFTGFGTVADIAFQYRRDGADVLIRGTVTAGTPTAVEARCSLPAGMTSSTGIAPLELAGNMAVTDIGAGTWYVLIEPSATYVTFGVANGGNAGLVKNVGSNLVGSGSSFSIYARVPLA